MITLCTTQMIVMQCSVHYLLSSWKYPLKNGRWNSLNPQWLSHALPDCRKISHARENCFLSPEVAHLLKSTSGQIQDGGWLPNFQYLNRYNSATNCSISLKFGTGFDHVTADTLQTFNVNGWKSMLQRDVTYQQWKHYTSETNRTVGRL